MRKLEKQTTLILFYIIYFLWLTILTFLNPIALYMNYFTVGIAVFYFLFLREEWDLLFFFLAAGILVLGTITSFDKWNLQFNTESIKEIPYWLPVAWGTTTVALHKFYVLMRDK